MSQKSTIFNTKTVKSLDITTTAKRSVDATTRPTILNHDKAVTDPMIMHRNSTEVNNPKDEHTSNVTVNVHENISNDTENDEDTDTMSSPGAEDISNLVDGKEYYVKIESPKARRIMRRIVVAVVLVITGLVVFATTIK